MVKKIGAGSEIDAWCTKCKLDLNHRVIAMEGSQPKRVECLTCRGHHNYRRPKSEDAKKTTTRKTTTRKTVAATRAAAQKAEQAMRSTWEKAIMGKAAGDFTAYKVSLQFKPGQLVRHKKFGDGVVSEIVEGGKMNVLFEDGAKLLVYGR